MRARAFALGPVAIRSQANKTCRAPFIHRPAIRSGEPSSDADVAGANQVIVQMWAGASPVLVQMWAGASPVPVQMWQG